MRRPLYALLALVPVAIWLWWPEPPAPPRELRPAKAARQVPAMEAEDLGAAPGAAARLEGRVLDASGAGVAGAEVVALAGDVVASARSGDAGAWRLDALAGGDYVLFARSGGSASAPLGPIPLAPGETLGALDLQLEQAASLAGTVRDALAGTTIEGARVEIAGAATQTDRAGRFRLEGIPPGAVVLRASAPGYEPRTEPLELPGRAVTGIDVGLRRGAAVAGRVVADGRPVPGASVRAIRYGLGGGSAGAQGAVTAADGTFALTVPAGQVELEAVAPDGSRGRSAPIELGPGARADGVEIRVEPAARLEGVVLDAAGRPAAGAAVLASSLDGVQLAAATAAADGTFALADLPSGMVRVAARRGEASGVSAPIAVDGGDVPHVEIRLGAAALAGRVEDGGGVPVPGARVIAWADGTPRDAAIASRTGADGRFRFEGLPEGPLRVEAMEGERRAEARGALAGTDVRLVLGGGRLVGRVFVDGRPATDFRVAAAPIEPGRGGAAAQRVLSEDGRFHLQLPPGRYEIRAGADGAGPAAQIAEAPGAGDSAEVVFELSAGGTIEGTVRDAATGAPLDGVRVSVSRSRIYAFGRGSDVPGEPGTLTGADGTFRLAGVPTDRRVPVFAWKPGYRPTRPSVVRAGEGASARVEIVLAPGGEGESAFGGVGLTLGRTRDAVVVAEVIEGGPGWSAGIRRGDRLVAVEGVAVAPADLAAAIDRVRGPVGTPVVLDLVRDGTWYRAAPLRAEIRF